MAQTAPHGIHFNVDKLRHEIAEYERIGIFIAVMAQNVFLHEPVQRLHGADPSKNAAYFVCARTR